MRKCNVIMILLVLSSFWVVRAEEAKKTLIAVYETKEGGEGTVKAELLVVKYSTNLLLTYSHVWGAELKKPKWVIQDLLIQKGEEKISVPLSAYCDLVNIEKVELKKNENKFVLIISGGEASTGYTAKLFFDNFLRRRIVRHNEFPDDAWDETTYHVNELDI